MLFIHNVIVRTRIYAAVLFVPTVFLGWLSVGIMFELRGGILIGAPMLAIVILLLYGCMLIWKHAAYLGKQQTLPDPHNWLSPNNIPLTVRIRNIIISFLFLSYGGWGLINNDLYLPSRRSGAGAHFHDIPLWLIFAAMSCAALSMISVVIDHYDRRNNELMYAHIATIFEWLGWLFFGLAFICKILTHS